MRRQAMSHTYVGVMSYVRWGRRISLAAALIAFTIDNMAFVMQGEDDGALSSATTLPGLQPVAYRAADALLETDAVASMIGSNRRVPEPRQGSYAGRAICGRKPISYKQLQSLLASSPPFS